MGSNNNGEWNNYSGAAAAILESGQAFIDWGKAKSKLDRTLKSYNEQLNGSLIDVNNVLDDRRFSILARNVAYSTYMGVAEKINKSGLHELKSDGMGALGFYLYKTYSFRVDSVRNIAITDGARNIFSKSISSDPTPYNTMHASFISTLVKNIALDNMGVSARGYMQRLNHPSSVLEAAELFNAKAVCTETWDKILDSILEKQVRESVQIDDVEHSA